MKREEGKPRAGMSDDEKEECRIEGERVRSGLFYKENSFN